MPQISTFIKCLVWHFLGEVGSSMERDEGRESQGRGQRGEPTAGQQQDREKY